MKVLSPLCSSRFFQQEPCQFFSRSHARRNIVPSQKMQLKGKQPVAASQSIRAFVGVHTELHQGIGHRIPKAFGADKRCR